MRIIVPAIVVDGNTVPDLSSIPEGRIKSYVFNRSAQEYKVEVDESFLNPARDLAAKLTIMDHLDELTEDDVMSASLLFEPWEPHKTYKAGDVRRWDGTLIKCLQDHTNYGPHHPPDITPSLWTIYRTVEAGYPDWEQPLSTNPYNATWDDGSGPVVVRHNGQLWINTHGDGNVWEPGVYGWELYE